MFQKYCSITNHYNEKDINHWLQYHPEIPNLVYVIQEKIHGSNLQLIFQHHQELRLASRNNLIGFDDGFYTAKSVIMKEWDFGFDAIQEESDKSGELIRVYGEIFGPKVQKGVDYGKERLFRIFDIEIGGRWLSARQVEMFLDNLDILHLMVPVLGYADSLEEALAFNVKLNSVLGEQSEELNNIMEGGVIKPYEKVIRSPEGSTFYIKKKNDEFKEKSSAKPVKDPTEGHTPEVVAWREAFYQYLNDHRVQAVFSKHGEIQKSSQLGEYIRWTVQDAEETFLTEEADFDKIAFNKKEYKFITNGGKAVATLLKEYL
jgi:Rnl2 family RNA ligase